LLLFVTSRYTVTFIFDSLTLNVCEVSAVTWSSSVPNFTAKSSNPRLSYCDFNIWPNDPVSHVALRSGIIFTKFELSQSIRSWFITFYCCYVTLHCDLHLWPTALERLQYVGCHVIKVHTKFDRKSNNRRLNYWWLSKLFIHLYYH